MARIHRNIQKDLHDPDNHDGVITHLEPDILECEVKWSLGSITIWLIHVNVWQKPLLYCKVISLQLIKINEKILKKGKITMNKASGGDRIPVELFQILKDDAVKVLHSICQQIWKMDLILI